MSVCRVNNFLWVYCSSTDCELQPARFYWQGCSWLEFIRSVHVYWYSNELMLMQNPCFNNLFNPITHIVTLASLSVLVIMRGMDIVCCPPENKDIGADEDTHKHDEFRHCHRGVGGTEYDPSDELEWPDAGRQEWSWRHTHRLSALTTCVIIVLHPSDFRRAYLCWSNCVAINIAPGLTGDTIACGVRATCRQRWSKVIFGYGQKMKCTWSSLGQARPVEPRSGQNWLIAIISSGTAGNFIINGPKSISSEQPSPKQAGFDIIDAILPGPIYGKGEYIFSWDKYALVYFELGIPLGGFFSSIPGRVNVTDLRAPPWSGHRWFQDCEYDSHSSWEQESSAFSGGVYFRSCMLRSLLTTGNMGIALVYVIVSECKYIIVRVYMLCW